MREYQQLKAAKPAQHQRRATSEEPFSRHARNRKCPTPTTPGDQQFSTTCRSQQQGRSGGQRRRRLRKEITFLTTATAIRLQACGVAVIGFHAAVSRWATPGSGGGNSCYRLIQSHDMFNPEPRRRSTSPGAPDPLRGPKLLLSWARTGPSPSS